MKKQSAQGFTLIELLVVLVILGLLGGIVGVKVLGEVEKAKPKTAIQQMHAFANALDVYSLNVGSYPSSDEGLDALKNDPGVEGWSGPYLKKIPQDPWNNNYVYRSPSENGDYEIISYGADKNEGGEGKYKDISSDDL